MKIGITAPGSSTHFMVRYMMAQAGLKADDAAFIGIGAGPTAVAAVRRGEIDALVNVDPVISLLESEKAIRVVADTRTLEGTRQVFGGAYPAAVLYVTPGLYPEQRPRPCRRWSTRWCAACDGSTTHPPRRSPSLMPAGICARRQGATTCARSATACRCFRRTAGSAREGPEVALKVLREFDPDVQRASIDLAATYTDAFVDKVPAR